MSRIKTLVLLFSLLNSVWFSTSYASTSQPSKACIVFYQHNQPTSRKVMVPAPEIAPITELWGSTYLPSSSQANNKIFNNRNTRNLDQCSSRECFLFAYLGALETTHLNRSRNSREIHFSAAYLVAKKFEHVIGEILSNNQNGRGMYFDLKGGETYHAMKLTQLYGLVPEDIWRPREPNLDKWDFPKIYSEIISKVNAIIEARNTNPNAHPPSDNARLTQEIFKEVLGNYVGEWPKPFWYDGIYHTPESFGKLYNFDTQGTIEVQHLNEHGPYENPAQSFNLPFFVNPLLSGGHFYSYRKSDSTQALFKTVENALAEDRAVLMDVDGNDPREAGVGHQFVVSNVQTENSKQVNAVRLKNSYTNWGNGGYIWYTPEGIAKKLRRIWIFDVNKDIPEPKPNPPKN